MSRTITLDFLLMTFSAPLTNPSRAHKHTLFNLPHSIRNMRQRAGCVKYWRGAYHDVIPQFSRSHSLHFVKQR